MLPQKKLKILIMLKNESKLNIYSRVSINTTRYTSHLFFECAKNARNVKSYDKIKKSNILVLYELLEIDLCGFI